MYRNNFKSLEEAGRLHHIFPFLGEFTLSIICYVKHEEITHRTKRSLKLYFKKQLSRIIDHRRHHPFAIYFTQMSVVNWAPNFYRCTFNVTTLTHRMRTSGKLFHIRHNLIPKQIIAYVMKAHTPFSFSSWCIRLAPKNKSSTKIHYINKHLNRSRDCRSNGPNNL